MSNRFIPRALNRLLSVIAMPLVAGCGEQTPLPIEPVECGPDEILQLDGTCLKPGVPRDLPCPPGELEVESGVCRPAGVPFNGCSAGFIYENGGCSAILPPDPCPFGLLALPGETECRAVSSCGEGTWGNIPVEPDAQFVDQAYAGNDSDGSEARPWKTIQEAIDNTQSGGMVAIAAGKYAEDVRIEYKQIRLWGRCPELVEISGAGMDQASVIVYAAQAASSELKGFAITGARIGLLISSVEDVRLEDLWIHDTASRGVNIQRDLARTSVIAKNLLIEAVGKSAAFIEDADSTWEGVAIRDNDTDYGVEVQWSASNASEGRTSIRGCLMERTAEASVFAYGGEMMIEDSVFYDSQPGIYDAPGIMSLGGQTPTTNLTVRGVVIERCYGLGLGVLGSTALIENTTIRDTQPDSMGSEGRAVTFSDDPNAKRRATATLRTSLLDRNREVAIATFGSDTTLEGVRIRNTMPNTMGKGGDGIYVTDHDKAIERPKLTVRGSVVEGCHHAAIALQGSESTIETSIIRDTKTAVEGIIGRGISIEYSYKTHAPSDSLIRSCIVENSNEIGIVVTASRALIESTTIRDTLSNALGSYGRGIGLQGDPALELRSEATVRACLIERNNETGMYISQSEITVEDTIVRDTKALASSIFGDGISIRDGSNVDFARLIVERNARAGIASFGSHAKVQSSTIRCNAFDIEGELSGDLPFSYDGSTGWQCSEIGATDCTTLGECNVRSTGLTPPPSLPPTEP